jgi:tetratricopeptide (TPR) repeat protein
MAEKKKTTASKSVPKQEVPEPKRRPAASNRPLASSGPGAAVIAHQIDGQRQRAAYEAGMKLFHLRKLREARGYFATAGDGPERDVANRAKLHICMCDRRLEQQTVVLNSAEDHYNYGVALMNARNAVAARENLEIALRMAPGADHIHYALGLAQALSGDIAGAFENIRRAIEIEPRNRLLARQEPDLAPFAAQPPFDSLLATEKKSW